MSDPTQKTALTTPTSGAGFSFNSITLNVLVDRSGAHPVPYFVPKEVGEAVGYAEPANLAKLINKRWADDLEEGEDWVLFSQKELGERFGRDNPSESLKGSTSATEFPTRGMILFTEQGLYGVIMLTRAPKGREFRKWLRAEVLPQIARDGAYSPHREIDAAGQLRIKEGELEVEKLRLQVQMAQIQAQASEAADRAAQARALEDLTHCIEGLGVDAINALKIRSVELLTGEDLAAYKPRLKAVHSPSSMALAFGVTARRVGMIISKLGLRGDPEMSQAILNTKAHSDGHVKSWLYDDRAYALIEEAVKAWKAEQ